MRNIRIKEDHRDENRVTYQGVTACTGPPHLAIAARLIAISSRCCCGCGGGVTFGGAFCPLGARRRRCTACTTVAAAIVVGLGADNFFTFRAGPSGSAGGGRIGLGSLKQLRKQGTVSPGLTKKQEKKLGLCENEPAQKSLCE